MPSTIISDVKDRHSLRVELERYLGPDIRGKWLCPFHDDHSPSLGLMPSETHYRCFSCGAKGSVIDLVMYMEGHLSPLAAAKFLDPSLASERPDPMVRRLPTPTPKPLPPPKPQHWRDTDWQVAADELIHRAENFFWSKAGRSARENVAARGITEATARRFRVGFMPEDARSVELETFIRAGERFRSIWCPRGLVIPQAAPGAWYGTDEKPDGPRWVSINVRCAGATPDAPPPAGRAKYKQFEGSERGHSYPFADLLPSQFGPPAVYFEGELDAMLGAQEFGHLAHPFSVGGSTQTDIAPDTWLWLAATPTWLIVGDFDEPGLKAVEWWMDQAPHKAIRLHLPKGKDVTEFAQSAGEGAVRDWMTREIGRLGMLPETWTNPHP